MEGSRFNKTCSSWLILTCLLGGSSMEPRAETVRLCEESAAGAMVGGTMGWQETTMASEAALAG